MDHNFLSTLELGATREAEVARMVAEQLEFASARLTATPALAHDLPVSISFPCERINILAFLSNSNQRPRSYWMDRDGSLEMGGVGSTLTIQEADHSKIKCGWKQIQEILAVQPDNTPGRFLGGTRFAPFHKEDNTWDGFPSFWFVLPEILFTRNGNEYTVTLTTLANGSESQEEVTEKLVEKLTRVRHLPCYHHDDIGGQMISRKDTPIRATWSARVKSALKDIENESIEKVVLARRTDLTFLSPVDPFAYLAALRQANSNCYIFLFEPAHNKAFVGASPERLFHLTGQYVETEAVSGTVPRGVSEAEERINSDRLLRSAKDLREQSIVVERIKEHLAQLCGEFEQSERPSLLKLSNVQHLITQFRGKLKPSLSIGDIYAALHPTPAVSGSPLEPALDCIEDLEDFDRGWYASGVGILSSKTADIVVAIRSALIEGNRISLFTGAGIVSGSDPDREWNELEQKMATALSVFSRTAV